MPLRASPGRLGILTLIAAVVGLATGGAAWLLLKLIAGITNLALFYRWDWSGVDLAGFEPSPWLPLVAMGGALTVSLLARSPSPFPWGPADRSAPKGPSS